jgi:hypothetical protein
MINVTVVFGMVEGATLLRMGYRAQPAGTTTKHADHSQKEPNGQYFLRTATDRNRSEGYNRSSYGEDTSRKTAAVSSLTPMIHNARGTKGQTYGVTRA